MSTYFPFVNELKFTAPYRQWLRVSPETVELLCSLTAPLLNHCRLMLESAARDTGRKEQDGSEEAEDAEKTEKAERTQKAEQKKREATKLDQSNRRENKSKESSKQSNQCCKTSPKKLLSESSVTSKTPLDSPKTCEGTGAERAVRYQQRPTPQVSQQCDKVQGTERSREQDQWCQQHERELPDHMYPLPTDWETAALHGTPLCPHTEQLLAGRQPSG